MNIPNNQAGTGAIPEIEDGIHTGRFDDIEVRVVESFKTDKDKFGHPDDGTRYDFRTTVFNEEGTEPVMLVDVLEGADDPTEEFVLSRTAKAVKSISGGERSNSYMYLKGILTATEMALFQASGKGDDEADAAWQAAAAKVNGRMVKFLVSHNDKDYPQIEAFLGPVKAKK